MKHKLDENWTCSSNEAITIQICSAGNKTHEFHPEFTYPFFGIDEEIYGFKDLSVRISFSSMSFRSLIELSYSEKTPTADLDNHVLVPLLTQMFDGVKDVFSIEDLQWTRSKNVFDEWLMSDSSIGPIGKAVKDFKIKNQSFSVYKSDFASCPKLTEWHKRAQVCMLFFIEGASFIEEDDRWSVYTIWEHQNDSMICAGFWTCYSYFQFPDKQRMRISQALIFPPFQGIGLGGNMYRFLYSTFKCDDDVIDITVEDPTEAFSDLRTINDLRLLLKDNAFKGNEIPDIEQIETQRLKYKD